MNQGYVIIIFIVIIVVIFLICSNYQKYVKKTFWEELEFPDPNYKYYNLSYGSNEKSGVYHLIKLDHLEKLTINLPEDPTVMVELTILNHNLRNLSSSPWKSQIVVDYKLPFIVILQGVGITDHYIKGIKIGGVIDIQTKTSVASEEDELKYYKQAEELTKKLSNYVANYTLVNNLSLNRKKTELNSVFIKTYSAKFKVLKNDIILYMTTNRTRTLSVSHQFNYLLQGDNIFSFSADDEKDIMIYETIIETSGEAEMIDTFGYTMPGDEQYISGFIWILRKRGEELENSENKKIDYEKILRYFLSQI